MERYSESTTMASLQNNNTSSSTLRFMGLLKQPDSDPNTSNTIDPFELEEGEVVWSSTSSFSSDVSTDAHAHSPPIPSPSTTALSSSNSPPHPRRPHHSHHHIHTNGGVNGHFNPSKSGLSAALSEDNHPHVRRKSTLNPTVSAASAAKTIPPVLRSDGLYINSNNGNPKVVKFHQSAPVNVPVWPKKKYGGEFRSSLDRFDEVDEDDDAAIGDDDEEMVPPHVIVARSHVTFSVFEGVGRTLKGRDLRRVRNAVFQKTGFID